MNTVTIYLVYIILTRVSQGSNGYTCGPKLKCVCFVYSGPPENVTMDCSGQKLNSLGEICETVGNATRLIVTSNHINGTLRDDTRLNGCQELLSLSLGNNTITDMEQEAIERFRSLRQLILSNNLLDIYKQTFKYLFKNLRHIELLALNGNRVNHSDISQWYPDLSYNTNLTTLYIDGLPETNISTNIFPNLAKLKTLVMTGANGNCENQYISDIFFQYLINLETLNLSMCNIALVELNAFRRLQNLQRLDLSQNRRLGLKGLYNISYSLQFTNITFMNYSYVQATFGQGLVLNKLDICFLRNTTLREIALDGNRIELLETNSLQLMPPTLHIVHMNDNRFSFSPYLLQLACSSNITDFYGSFQYLAHNPILYKDQDNILNTKPRYLKHCPFMDESYLQNVSNHMENCQFLKQNESFSFFPTIPRYVKKFVFSNCKLNYKLINVLVVPLQNNVEYIDVSGNIFFNWEGPIGPFPKLKYLDLSRNYCSKVERKFFEFKPRLENLQIHTNLLGLTLSSESESTKDVFHDLTSLRILNLSMNKISHLHPLIFKDLNNLEVLDLSFNTINKWVFEIDDLSNFTNVNLSWNAIPSLPITLTQHLYEISKRRDTPFSIDLRNNPLRYNCQTREFLKWMVGHKQSFVGFEEYVFVDDDENEFSSYDMENRIMYLDKICKSYIIWIVISVIGVSVALSVIIGGLVYRNRWKLRYFMYMSKQRFYGYVRIPNEEPIENYKYDAFISYAEENIRFVKDQIIPHVEVDDISLCIHQRDFLPGNVIADNIIDAIKSSKKTVVLLTKAFLKRKWCVYEFNMARMESIYSRDGQGCLVIVMLESVLTKDMSTELLEWIKTESYLEYSTDEDGEPLFWNNLISAIKQG